MLATASLLAALQSACWSVPGTLAGAYAAVYGLDGDATQLLANWGCIMFFVGALPSMWALDRLGSAAPLRAAAALLLASSALRSAAPPAASPASAALMHASAILCSLAGPIAMCCPARLAQDWHPAHERGFATALVAMASQVGGGIVYAAVPLLCPLGDAPGLARLNALLLGLCAASAAMALAYLPAAPPAPPSPSAQLAAPGAGGASPLALLRALGALFRRPAFVALAAAYAATGGVFSAAGAFLPTNLAALGASLSAAAWVGVAVNAGSLALGVGAAAASDWLKLRCGAGSAKFLLVGVTLASGACFGVFAGLAAGAGAGGAAPPSALPLAASAYVLGSSLLAAQVALSFDLAAEHAFGAGPEGACLMGVSLPMNTVTLVALCAPAASLFTWINWAQAAVCCGAGGLLWVAVPASAPKSEFDYAQLAGEGGNAEGRG